MASATAKKSSRAYRIVSRLLGGFILLWACVIISPKLLAFPHHAQVGQISVYSEAPITPHINGIVARSQQLLRKSAIYSDHYGKTIYLTDGGWRWKLLSGPNVSYTFALGRPWIETIVFNRTDLKADRVYSAALPDRSRTMSGTIAHEQTHGLLRSYLGLKAFTAPNWKIEGYCDHIAQDGGLTDKQAAKLAETNPKHRAYSDYYLGRKRVAVILEKNGGSVGKLFAE
jgi:hypothetical protein